MFLNGFNSAASEKDIHAHLHSQKLLCFDKSTALQFQKKRGPTKLMHIDSNRLFVHIASIISKMKIFPIRGNNISQLGKKLWYILQICYLGYLKVLCRLFPRDSCNLSIRCEGTNMDCNPPRLFFLISTHMDETHFQGFLKASL